jgi:CDP-glucose 4,6-dehydratase
VGRGITDIRLDIRDSSALFAAFEVAEPSVVFHLAAQALVRASYESPVETYSTNVMGTANVLEAIRRSRATTAAVIFTSDKCYENRETGQRYAEQDPLGGHDPYSSSKACAELVTAAYRRSFMTGATAAVATVRAGNVIGGGDWAVDRLVPDLVRAFSTGAAARIRSPAAVRPWQHVLEPVSGCLRLAEKLSKHGAGFAEPWNFGPDPSDVRTVEEVVTLASSQWGAEARWTTDDGLHPHEAMLLNLDASKARERLGWRPRWRLEATVRETIGWYKAFEDGMDMRGLTLAQIARYAEAVSE